MKVTTEPLESRQLSVAIEVDDDRARRAMHQAARQIARQVNIPGFRKGKAPYDVIIQRYGEDAVRQEAADILVNDVYKVALEQHDIDPYGAGKVEDVSLDPFTFKFTVPLAPLVDLAGYRDYRSKPRTVRVYKKEIQQALEEIRDRNAILEPLERPVELGDLATLDIRVHSVHGDEIFNQTGNRVVLDEGDEDLIPGFSAAVVGMKVEDEHSFALPLPDDFPQENMRGQQATFDVKLVQVHKRTLPDIDDDLARVAGNYDTLNELEKDLKEKLRAAAQKEADEAYARDVLEAIVEQASAEYPPVMLEDEIDELVKQLEQTVKRDSHLALEDWLKLQSKGIEDLRAELTPQAEKRVKRALVMGEVVRKEGLVLEEAELDTQIEEISTPWGARAGDVRSSLSTDKGRRALSSRLLGNKAVQRLVEIAKGEAPEPDSGSNEE